MDTIAEIKPGTEVVFSIIRQGKPMDIKVQVEEDLRFQNLNP